MFIHMGPANRLQQKSLSTAAKEIRFAPLFVAIMTSYL
jgi:hypothetical protein